LQSKLNATQQQLDEAINRIAIKDRSLTSCASQINSTFFALKRKN